MRFSAFKDVLELVGIASVEIVLLILCVLCGAWILWRWGVL